MGSLEFVWWGEFFEEYKAQLLILIIIIRLKLFAHGNLRVHIISYLPTQNKYYFLRVQIISYLPTQK